MKLLQRRFTIFPKLVVTFLLVIIPLYLLSFQMNERGADNVKDKILNSMMSQVHFFMTNLEQELGRITRQQREMMNDDDLQILGAAPWSLSDFEKTQAIKRVHKKLDGIRDSSAYISIASAHLLELDRTISTSDFVTELRVEEFAALQTKNSLLHWNNRLFLSEYFPNPPLPQRESSMFAIGMELSKSSLKEALHQFSIHENGAVTALIHDEWTVVSQSEDVNADKMISLWRETDFREPVGIEAVVIEGMPLLVAYQHSESLGITLLSYVPEDRVLQQLHSYRDRFWYFSGISLLIIFIFSYWIYRLIHKPLQKLVLAFQQVKRNNLDVTMQHYANDEFQLLYSQFNSMVDRLNVLIHEVYEHQLRLRRSELKQLQSQINPHFLYNGFFILYAMARRNDIDNIERFTKHLGEYFRFITKNGEEEIPLSMEVSHARAYVEIQTIRIGKRIEAQFQELPEEFKEYRVPRLILQPLLENAYEHGLANIEEDGRLIVSFQASKDALHICIEDNGNALDEGMVALLQKQLQGENTVTEGTALINVHHRLRLRYGEYSGLELTLNKWRGLTVCVRLPLTKGAANVQDSISGR